MKTLLSILAVVAVSTAHAQFGWDDEPEAAEADPFGVFDSDSFDPAIDPLESAYSAPFDPPPVTPPAVVPVAPWSRSASVRAEEALVDHCDLEPVMARRYLAKRDFCPLKTAPVLNSAQIRGSNATATFLRRLPIKTGRIRPIKGAAQTIRRNLPLSLSPQCGKSSQSTRQKKDGGRLGNCFGYGDCIHGTRSGEDLLRCCRQRSKPNVAQRHGIPCPCGIWGVGRPWGQSGGQKK